MIRYTVFTTQSIFYRNHQITRRLQSQRTRKLLKAIRRDKQSELLFLLFEMGDLFTRISTPLSKLSLSLSFFFQSIIYSVCPSSSPHISCSSNSSLPLPKLSPSSRCSDSLPRGNSFFHCPFNPFNSRYLLSISLYLWSVHSSHRLAHSYRTSYYRSPHYNRARDYSHCILIKWDGIRQFHPCRSLLCQWCFYPLGWSDSSSLFSWGHYSHFCYYSYQETQAEWMV